MKGFNSSHNLSSCEVEDASFATAFQYLRILRTYFPCTCTYRVYAASCPVAKTYAAGAVGT